MLTLKHISPINVETILSVKWVKTVPAPEIKGVDKPPQKVQFVTTDGEHDGFDDGCVFVMNELGQTVASYRYLGDSGLPKIL